MSSVKSIFKSKYLVNFLWHAQSINKQIYIMKETQSQGMSKEQF